MLQILANVSKNESDFFPHFSNLNGAPLSAAVVSPGGFKEGVCEKFDVLNHYKIQVEYFDQNQRKVSE